MSICPPPNEPPTSRHWTSATPFCRPTAYLGSLEGWNRFVMLSARSVEGRRAMRAHRDARRIAHATPAKLRALGLIFANHPGAKTVIFTEDNATAYEVSQRFPDSLSDPSNRRSRNGRRSSTISKPASSPPSSPATC
jgi:superfamily II DNA or RNA helicase